MREITLGSLFDGIGGFPYAASFYGIRPLWASEIVPSCVSVTKKFFPDMAHVGDVTSLDGAKLPPVDIIAFGSPCQGLSLAGQRRGLADERSGLFLEAIRIIFEMREATHGRYPRFALFENVPYALKHIRDVLPMLLMTQFTLLSTVFLLPIALAGSVALAIVYFENCSKESLIYSNPAK